MSALSLKAAVKFGENSLAALGFDTPRLDAELILSWALGIDRIAIILLPEKELTSDEHVRYTQAIARRAQHEPVAYITGKKEFWSMSFFVTHDTLIPRPDSETLIDIAARKLTFDQPKLILDLGTGSGCLLLAALQEFPHAHGLGIDQSTAAIAVAKRNAEHLDMADRAQFQTGNWTSGLDAKFDLILCNPPYIAETERATLPPDVVDYEPTDALFAGVDGLDAYQRIIPDMARLLSKTGIALLEIGHKQQGSVRKIAGHAGFIVTAYKDMAHRDRVLLLTGA